MIPFQNGRRHDLKNGEHRVGVWVREWCLLMEGSNPHGPGKKAGKGYPVFCSSRGVKGRCLMRESPSISWLNLAFPLFNAVFLSSYTRSAQTSDTERQSDRWLNQQCRSQALTFVCVFQNSPCTACRALSLCRQSHAAEQLRAVPRTVWLGAVSSVCESHQEHLHTCRWHGAITCWGTLDRIRRLRRHQRLLLG